MVLLYNMLCVDFSITVFSFKHYIFMTKYTSNEMSSFLHRWDYCWKCEYDAGVNIRIENDYQHDREQLAFCKEVHIKT